MKTCCRCRRTDPPCGFPRWRRGGVLTEAGYCYDCRRARQRLHGRDERKAQPKGNHASWARREARYRRQREPLLAERAARGEPLFPLPAALVG